MLLLARGKIVERAEHLVSHCFIETARLEGGLPRRVATPRDGVVFGTRYQSGANTPMTQSVINPKAIDAQPP
jgi:hypothetical protein